MAVTQSQLEIIAKKGNYTFNVNPRQILINNVGMDGYTGGGNLMVGESASDLDKLLVTLGTMPRALIDLDIGTFYEHWVRVTLADVRTLRALFFALYGLGKQNWYGPPLYPPGRPPVALFVDDQTLEKEFMLLLDSPNVTDAYLAVD